MKSSLAKLWHGFLYGIGFAVAWWLVFGALGFSLFKQYLPKAAKPEPTAVQQQKDDTASQLKKRLGSVDMDKLHMAAPQELVEPKAE